MVDPSETPVSSIEGFGQPRSVCRSSLCAHFFSESGGNHTCARLPTSRSRSRCTVAFPDWLSRPERDVSRQPPPTSSPVIVGDGWIAEFTHLNSILPCSSRASSISGSTCSAIAGGKFYVPPRATRIHRLRACNSKSERYSRVVRSSSPRH